MNKEELEKEAKEYAHNNYKILVDTSNAFVTSEDYLEQGYIAGAELREKRIADLEKELETENAELKQQIKYWKAEYEKLFNED